MTRTLNRAPSNGEYSYTPYRITFHSSDVGKKAEIEFTYLVNHPSTKEATAILDMLDRHVAKDRLASDA